MILNNYLGQLMRSYPEKAEVLEWMKYALDNRMTYFGEHFKTPYEVRPLKLRVRERLGFLYKRMRTMAVSYEGAVISNAYFNVSDYIQKEGYNVVLPPWQTQNISKEAQETLYQMMYADFNLVLTDDYLKRVYNLRDELREFFTKNKTPFVLLANDLVPVHRIAIDVCKELGIPTGVFLHGLPGRYDALDDSRGDYLFVWGEKIKENYINAGSKTNIIVTGHPNFSSFKLADKKPENVLVLSRSINGASPYSDRHYVDERGICIQHIYALETALRKTGIDHAVLRLHPSENPEWYAKFMDKDFYTLDTHPLSYSISHAKMVVGYISTVMLDTVLNDIPCYPYVFDKESNRYADEIVPPFCNRPDFPTAYTVDELVKNLKTRHCVTKEHFDGYINPTFDVKIITQFIKR